MDALIFFQPILQPASPGSALRRCAAVAAPRLPLSGTLRALLTLRASASTTFPTSLASSCGAHDDAAFLKFLTESGLIGSLDAGDHSNAWGSFDAAPAAHMPAAVDGATAAAAAAVAPTDIAPWPIAEVAALPRPLKRRRSVDSGDTLPMPAGADAHRRKRAVHDDEATSSSPANDLAGLPRARGAAAAAAIGAAGAPEQHNNRAAAQAAAAAEAEGVFKAVLVAKVLTKSDASSKRIILPRIAIEANLPHLTSGGGGFGQGRALHFPALDRAGREWPLCIKAWANGANPKPVFVLEGGVGELMKTHRLGPGDVVGVLASEDGRHFVHWNTDQVRDAAARPTLCAFEFAEHNKRQEAAAADAAAPAPAAEPLTTAMQQQQQQQQQQQDTPTVSPPPTPTLVPSRPSAAAPFAATPLMAAVPFASSLVVPGFYLPSPACEMLVMGPGAPIAEAACAPCYLPMDGDGPSGLLIECAQPALGGSPMLLPLPPMPSLTAADIAVAALPPAAVAAAEAPVAAPAAAVRVGSILHQGGALLCSRTTGCKRPAGHQGWCLGHGSKRTSK
jgi:hypothetical protein